MTLLVPRVREENKDLIHGIIRKLVLQDLDGIVAYDAKIAYLRLLGAQQ